MNIVSKNRKGCRQTPLPNSKGGAHASAHDAPLSSFPDAVPLMQVHGMPLAISVIDIARPHHSGVVVYTVSTLSDHYCWPKD